MKPIAKTLAFAAVLVLASVAFGAETVADPAHSGDKGESNFITETFVAGVTALAVFLISLAILAKFAWKPILGGLQAREDKIRNDLTEAERSRTEAQAKLDQYQKQLAEAEVKIREMFAKAQVDADAAATRVKMSAQKEVEEMKTRATREIDDARRNAVGQVQAEAANLATMVASKILKRQISDQDQADLVRASLDELQSSSRR